MKALISLKKWQDRKGGPIYEEGEIWFGDEERAKKIIEANVAKEATNAELKNELEARDIEFDAKANKDELIELLKGE